MFTELTVSGTSDLFPLLLTRERGGLGGGFSPPPQAGEE